MSKARNLLLLAVAAVCAVSFWLAHRSPAPPLTAGSALAAAEGLERTIRLTVLNGTGQPGLARRYSRDLSALGCVVVAIADAPDDSFESSLLVNRCLPAEMAQRLASRLHDVSLLWEWDSRAEEDAVLVLGRDHARIFASRQVQP